MFDNLVESGSHSKDVARKGSFILITMAIYAVFLLTAFVAGIWWATANIDQQTLELTALIAPVPVPAAQKVEAAKPEKLEINKNVDVRRELIADVTRTDLVPKEISAKASDVPPVRKGVVTMLGGGDSNAVAPMAPGATPTTFSMAWGWPRGSTRTRPATCHIKSLGYSALMSWPVPPR